MALSYAAEKYGRARDLMATGRGVLRERLREAFVYQLAYVKADRDLPDGLREEHEQLVAQVTRADDHAGVGKLAATLAVMADQELTEVAAQILALEYRIRGLHEAPPWHYMGRATAVIRLPESPRELHPDDGERPPPRN